MYRTRSGTNQWLPDIASETFPETEPCPAEGWLDRLPGNAPFSPVLSDFTVPTSETSLASIGPSSTQDLSVLDLFTPRNWSAELTDRSYIDEPTVSATSFFPSREYAQPSEMPQAPEYRTWFTPSEVSFDNYFQMDQSHGLSGFAPVAPQTAGFVGSTPVVPSSQSTSCQATDAQFDPASAAHCHADSLPVVPTGQTYQVNQFPELTQAAPPRRFSVAVQPSTKWSSDKAGQQPLPAVTEQVPTGSVHDMSAIPIPKQRMSRPSVAGNSRPGASPAASSLSHVKMERASSRASQLSTRTGSEFDEGKPRSHKLYTEAKPRSDGYYHCPYLGTGACAHKATKLKCNYE